MGNPNNRLGNAWCAAALALLTLSLPATAFAHAGGGGSGGGGGGGGGASAGGGGRGSASSGASGAAHGPSAGGPASTGGAASAGGGSAGVSNAAGGANGGAASGRSGQTLCQPGYIAIGGGCQKLHAGLLPDEQLYETGRALALAGNYAQALAILEAVTRANDPMVFTMRGYALRKLGHFDAAMVLYRQALAIDPGNVNTHEYLGEGYVQIGRLERARAELRIVENGCGTSCEQYEDLKRAIDTRVIE